MRIRGLGCLAALCFGSAETAAPLTIPPADALAEHGPLCRPDGKRLVFISVVAGKEQLFTMNADASDAIQITRDDANKATPAAFTAHTPQGFLSAPDAL